MKFNVDSDGKLYPNTTPSDKDSGKEKDDKGKKGVSKKGIIKK